VQAFTISNADKRIKTTALYLVIKSLQGS